MSKKQKEKKKKNRELIAKKRIIARRNVLRKQTSEKKKLEFFDKQFREKVNPIVNEKNKELEDIKNKNILCKLEKNIKILEALEQEYENEMQSKEEINKELESQGNFSMKEKMDALEDKMKNKIKEKNLKTCS